MRAPVELFVRAAVVAAASIGFAVAAAAQPYIRPAAAPSLAAARVETADNAASLLRELALIHEYEDGVALGAGLVKRFPRNSRVRAWYVENLVSAGRQSMADSLTIHTDTLSRDPWLLATRAFSRLRAPIPSKAAIAEAGRLARKARALAPRDPDLAVLVAQTFVGDQLFFYGQLAEAVAFVDSVGPSLGNPVELQVTRANALFSLGMPSPGSMQVAPLDTAKRSSALNAYALARTADSTNFDAIYDYAARLNLTRPDEAFALMKLAVRRAPRSGNAHVRYWSTINAQRGLPVAEKRAAITSDRAEYLIRTDSAPWALLDVINTNQVFTPEASVEALEERVLARAPRSRWAEEVLLRRASQWSDSLYVARDTTLPGPKSDSSVVKRRYIEGMQSFLGKRWVANASARDQAAWRFFFLVREDSTYPTEKLVALVKDVVAGNSTNDPNYIYGWGARALADRRVEFPLAEKLAREAARRVATNIDDNPGYRFSSVGDKTDALDAAQAESYDDLAWVFFKEGRLDDAEKEFGRALDLTKKNVNIFYDLGRLRAAQGRNDEAELTFAQGMTLRYRGVNPNRKELEQLYAKNHGSMDGWAAYVASLEVKERATRLAKILDTRLKDAKVAESFHLSDIAGHIVSSDSLKGHYAIVNFWGTWCGPCVAEVPELQQFSDKYRNDPAVEILTISNDKDLAELKNWISKRKFTVPTLFDDGWVADKAQVFGFPTTWFLDREGKMQFRVTGNAGALVEEWSWRLEAMRGQAATVP